LLWATLSRLGLGCSSNYIKTPFYSFSCDILNFEQICP
jgi:hypothetical protein